MFHPSRRREFFSVFIIIFSKFVSAFEPGYYVDYSEFQESDSIARQSKNSGFYYQNPAANDFSSASVNLDASQVELDRDIRNRKKLSLGRDKPSEDGFTISMVLYEPDDDSNSQKRIPGQRQPKRIPHTTPIPPPSTSSWWSKSNRWHRPNTTPRFAYQNTLLVAPTLPPTQATTKWNRWDIPRPTTPRPTTPRRTTLRPSRKPLTSTERSRWTTSRNTRLTTIRREPLTEPTTTGWADWTTAKSTKITTTTTTEYLSPCELGSTSHRYDRTSGQCYLLESTEPCGGSLRNMAFYALDSIYGVCDCIQNSSRPLVYHPESDTCYFIYQQAYCAEKDWLSLTPDGKPKCSHNPCWEYGEKALKWNWTKNSDTVYMNTKGIVPIFEKEQCVPLGHLCMRLQNGTLIFPTSAQDQDVNYIMVLEFQSGNLQPTCHRRDDTVTDATDKTIRCRPGSKQHITGGCEVTDRRPAPPGNLESIPEPLMLTGDEDEDMIPMELKGSAERSHPVTRRLLLLLFSLQLTCFM